MHEVAGPALRHQHPGLRLSNALRLFPHPQETHAGSLVLQLGRSSCLCQCKSNHLGGDETPLIGSTDCLARKDVSAVLLARDRNENNSFSSFYRNDGLCGCIGTLYVPKAAFVALQEPVFGIEGTIAVHSIGASGYGRETCSAEIDTGASALPPMASCRSASNPSLKLQLVCRS